MVDNKRLETRRMIIGDFEKITKRLNKKKYYASDTSKKDMHRILNTNLY